MVTRGPYPTWRPEALAWSGLAGKDVCPRSLLQPRRLGRSAAVSRMLSTSYHQEVTDGFEEPVSVRTWGTPGWYAVRGVLDIFMQARVDGPRGLILMAASPFNHLNTDSETGVPCGHRSNGRASGCPDITSSHEYRHRSWPSLASESFWCHRKMLQSDLFIFFWVFRWFSM